MSFSEGLMVTDSRTNTLVMKFRADALLRYLSHHETMAMLTRALVRSGITLYYTQGFNPRPKLSLPLPTSVGMVSHCQLLTCRIIADPSLDQRDYRKCIAEQLPSNCEILSVEIEDGKVSYQPVAAEYLFTLDRTLIENLRPQVRRLADALTERTPLMVESARTRNRTRDVAPYLESITVENQDVLIKCRITPTGTIRIEEMLTLLGLEIVQMRSPITRISTQWNRN